MLDEEQIGDLLVRWHEARGQGRELPIEELCADCPELAEEVAVRIHSVQAMSWLMDAEAETSPSRNDRSTQTGAAELPASSLSIDQFLDALVTSGLRSEANVESLRIRLNADSAREFAALLVDSGELTRFQACNLLESSDLPLLLDQYEVLDHLGEGGMGVVFKARHRTMDRLVAVKMLPPEAVNSEDKLRRFRREVKTSAKLVHPNIVTTYDARQAKGKQFLVMEYIDGRDLSQVVVMHGPLTTGKAIDFVRQAAIGLEYAHSQRICHRDIKPSNLILDRSGTIKILDMGLAHVESLQADEGITLSGELTQSGSVMGTVGFMPPEQALDTADADERSDIYSLGCTLFFLITGRLPYHENTMMKTVMAHQQQSIPSLRELNGAIPAEVDQVFQRMLAKDPQQRFQNATELISALQACEVHDDSPPLSLDAPVKDQTLIDTMSPATTSRMSSSKSSSPELRRPSILTAVACLVIGVSILLGIVIKLETPWGRFLLSYEETPPRKAQQEDALPAQQASIKKTVPPLPSTISQADRALSFDGVGDYVLIPSLTYDGSHPITIEAIVHVAAVPDGESGVPIVSNLSFPRIGDGIQLALIKDDLRWAIGHQHGPDYIRKTSQAKVGQTVHLAGVVDEDSLQLFVDGKLVSAHPHQMSFEVEGEDQRPFLIGGGWSSNGGILSPGFTGRIDNIHLSRVARYSEDFVPETELIHDDDTLAIFYCDQSSGTELIDSSGNGHHGKIHGAVWVHADGTPVPEAIWPEPAPALAIAPFDREQAQIHQQAWAEYLNLPVEKVVELTDELAITFSLIPPGEFAMGSSDAEREKFSLPFEESENQSAIGRIASEGPEHRVSIDDPFYLGKLEVTQAQWQAVMGSNPSRIDDPTYPVTNVTWNDSQQFLNRLNENLQAEMLTIRLPTEAEWEFACRAGSQSYWHYGDDPQVLVNHGWFLENSAEAPHPAGQLKANAFGLHDMSGNVLEWCSDWYGGGYYRYAPSRSPGGPLWGTHRVVRGGGWNSDATACRSAQRHFYHPDRPLWSIGVRLVASINNLEKIPAATNKVAKEEQESQLPGEPWYGWPDSAPAPAIAPFDAKQAEQHQQAWAEHLELPIQHTSQLPNGQQISFKLIPPGEFMMGTSAEEVARITQELLADKEFARMTDRTELEAPQHRVVLTRPLYLAKTEVTIGQFRAFVDDTNHVTTAEEQGFGQGFDETWGTYPDFNWREYGIDVTDSHPVVNVSWLDAVAFCQWLSEKESLTYRLPTEAEWEFACRAGTMGRWSVPNEDIEQLNNYAWFKPGSLFLPHPVATRNANPFGLFDLMGNVFELCSNRSGDYPTGLSVDPQDYTDQKLVSMRGGFFGLPPLCVRSASRLPVPTDRPTYVHGFRVALECHFNEKSAGQHTATP